MCFHIATAASSLASDDKPVIFNRCWETPSAVDLAVTPVSDGATIFFLDTAGKLTAMETAQPTRRWSTEIGGDVVSNQLVTHTALFVVTVPSGSAGDASLRAISKQTGVTMWTTGLPRSVRIFLGMINGSLVAVASDGTTTALAPDRGSIIWRQSIGAAANADPLFTPGRLVVATDRNEIVSISPTGSVEITAKAAHAATALVGEDQGRVLAGDERGNLMHFSPSGSELWKFRNGARISYLALYESEYIAASDDNFVYRISRGGNVEWKRRLPGRLSTRPVIIGETAVMSIIGEPSIYAISLDDGKISNRILAGSEEAPAIAIAAGASAFAALSAQRVSLYNGMCPAK